jgi:hypothetical protein
MNKYGFEVFVCVKDIPSAIYLLDKYSIKYIRLGKKNDSILGKLFNQVRNDIQIYKIVKNLKIEFGLGSSMNIPHVSRISHMKSFIFDDDDSLVEPLFAKFTYSFADYIISPDILKFQNSSSKFIYYSGYHELAYLHPKRFIPDQNVLKELDLKINEKYFVLRFNAFKAHHDIGEQGLSIEKKRKIIKILSNEGKIFINTERDIEPEFAQYQLKMAPEKMHSLLYYATLFIGDSQTMTSEAAVLGTPAIRSNSFVGRISYLEEQEHKYGLTFGFKLNQFNEMVRKIEELLKTPNLKEIWSKRRFLMLEDKIDVTAFMVWFIKEFPGSYRIIKENPGYQYSFR